MAREYKKKGNPFKRGNTWTFIYYVTDADGKRKQVWKGGYATKKEAEADLKIYRAKAVLEAPVPVCKDSLENYLKGWFEIHRKMIEPSSANGYRNSIERHIIPALGKVKLRDLKPSMVTAFYFELLEKKNLSPKTVQCVHRVLRAALNDAVSENLISENPCLKAKTPKAPKYKHTPLSQEQLKILFDYLDGNRYEIEIKLAALLGLRRGEVLGLKFSDWDLQHHTIFICRQVSIIRDSKVQPGIKSYGLKGVKSECSNRTLYLSADIENLLFKRKNFIEMQKKILGESYQDNDLICCNDDGTIMSPYALYSRFKRIIKLCGLPDIRFHDLRHSYATLCIDLGIPIKAISQALGHSASSVTDDIYADSIAAKRKMSDIVSRAVLGEIEQTVYPETEKNETNTA